MEQEHILVVDDDEGLLHLLKMRLSAMGFMVTPCTTGQDATAEAKKTMFNLAITDLRLRRGWVGRDRRTTQKSSGSSGHHPDGPWQYSQCRGGHATGGLRVPHEAV